MRLFCVSLQRAGLAIDMCDRDVIGRICRGHAHRDERGGCENAFHAVSSLKFRIPPRTWRPWVGIPSALPCRRHAGFRCASGCNGASGAIEGRRRTYMTHDSCFMSTRDALLTRWLMCSCDAEWRARVRRPSVSGSRSLSAMVGLLPFPWGERAVFTRSAKWVPRDSGHIISRRLQVFIRAWTQEQASLKKNDETGPEQVHAEGMSSCSRRSQ